MRLLVKSFASLMRAFSFMPRMRAFCFSPTCSRLPKTIFQLSIQAIMMTTMAGARWMRKSTKSRPALEAIMMLGGSPMSVAVPPMLEARASVMR